VPLTKPLLITEEIRLAQALERDIYLQIDHPEPGLLPGHVEKLLRGPDQVIGGQVENFEPVEMIEHLFGK
jgi:hypothetical protein